MRLCAGGCGNVARYTSGLCGVCDAVDGAGGVRVGASSSLRIGVKRLREFSRMPALAHAGDACLDAYAAAEVRIEPGRIRQVPLGIALSMPRGIECQVRGRSGLSLGGVLVILGTVDSGYRGEVSAIVLNVGEDAWTVRVGHRVAQLAFRSMPDVELEELEELEDTERGARGFGSTGGVK